MSSGNGRSVGSALSREVLASESFDVSDSAALFVGVRLFRNGQFAEVPFAIDDAVDLAYTFISLGLVTGGKTRLCLHGEPRKEQSVQRLIELRELDVTCRPAGMSDIYEALDEQRLLCGEHGIFLVGVASHGVSHDGKDLVLAADTVRSALLRTSVEVTEIFKAVGLAKAPRRMVLLDACREQLESSGRSVSDRESGPPMTETFAKAIARASGQVVLSGTVSGGYSYDDARRGNGVFSGAVIDGLRGKAPGDERNLITAETLAAFVEAQVQAWLEANAKDHLGIGKNFDGMCKDMPLATALLESRPSQVSNAEDRYREEVRRYLDNFEISPIERESLEEDRVEWDLSVDVAAAIEAEELERSGNAKRRALEGYGKTVRIAIETYGYPIPAERREELKVRQAKLRLRDDDVAAMEAVLAAELGLDDVEDERAAVERSASDTDDGARNMVIADETDDDAIVAVELRAPSPTIVETAEAGEDEPFADLGVEAPVDARAEMAQHDDVLSTFIDAQIISERAVRHGDLDLAACASVTHVAQGSPAERLGVAEGDIVIRVNGTAAGDLNGSLHRSDSEPTTLEFRTARRGYLTVETTGVDLGLTLRPTPEAVMASPTGFMDAQNFRHLWELGETRRLWALSLVRARHASTGRFESTETQIEEIPALFESGDLEHGELCLLYLGGRLIDAGDTRGVELVSSFMRGDMRGYTLDQHVVAEYYTALAEDTESTRDRTLATLRELYRMSPSERIASTIRRLGGIPPEKGLGRVGQVFPVRYRLRVLGARTKVSLDATLASLGPEQLHIVCLLDRYRSNGPYHFSLFDYQNLARHMPAFLPGIHVITSTDGTDEGADKAQWYKQWMRQEEVVRAEGLAIEILHDKRNRITEEVHSDGVPHFLMLDSDGVIRFDSAVDGFGADVWTALRRLLDSRAESGR